MGGRGRWFTSTDGSASREQLKFGGVCAHARITLFVLFRRLTFTCEGRLVSIRRRLEEQQPPGSRSEVIRLLTPASPAQCGSRCGASERVFSPVF